jgi:hypothetical protein
VEVVGEVGVDDRGNVIADAAVAVGDDDAVVGDGDARVSPGGGAGGGRSR